MDGCRGQRPLGETETVGRAEQEFDRGYSRGGKVEVGRKETEGEILEELGKLHVGEGTQEAKGGKVCRT